MNKGFAIDYCKDVNVNGNAQNIRVRAAKEGLPVILFLHGGPGVSDRHNVLKYQSALADRYTLVCWDQRGSGKSYTPEIKKEKLSVRTYIEDAKTMLDVVTQMFGVEKVIVAGHSWGTIIGLPTVVEKPEKVAAYIAQGVFIDGAENELQSYLFCVREAERRGDKAAIKALSGIRPVDGRYPNNKAMMTQRNYLSKYGGGVWKEQKGLIGSILQPLIKSGEYSIGEIVNYAKGALYLPKVLWDDCVSANYTTVTELKVPVIVTQGEHDFNTPTAIAREWFDKLSAPYKRWYSFAESAHSPIAEEPEKWGAAVTEALAEAGI